MVVASVIFVFNYLPKLAYVSLLEQIKDDGQLIVITRNSPTTYYEGPDGPAGLEYELVKMFADELGVELTLLVPDTLNDLLRQIEAGDAHIAAAGLTITPEREKNFRFGPSYQQISEQLIYNVSNIRPVSLSKLDGSLEVVTNSSHAERLKKLKEKYPALNWKESYDMESEDLLQMVSDNIIEYTIADSNEFALTQRFLINLRAAFDINGKQSLAWMLPRAQDNSLYLEVQKFFKKIRENGELQRLLERAYGHVENFDYVGTKIFMRHIGLRLPRYRDFFEKAAAENGLDWRLLAAMGYQESHWDPDAVSATGVRGIMMLTRRTARELKIKNRLDPKSSIEGGARYFRKTLDRMDKNIPDPDRTWMAMAAYNVGFYHLQDARLMAKRLNKDPNRWIDIKETLPLLAKRKWYKQTRYGFARGWEPVQYVENIRSYYDILKWVDEGDLEVTPVPEEFFKIPNSL